MIIMNICKEDMRTVYWIKVKTRNKFDQFIVWACLRVCCYSIDFF